MAKPKARKKIAIRRLMYLSAEHYDCDDGTVVPDYYFLSSNRDPNMSKISFGMCANRAEAFGFSDPGEKSVKVRIIVEEV